MTTSRDHSKGFARSGLLLLAISLACSLGGCAVVTLARGKPGMDLSPIQPGVDRQVVEIRLREPFRTSTTSKGVEYAWYLYDGGVRRSVGRALGAALLDLDMMLFELVVAMQAVNETEALRVLHHYDLVAVSYDSQGLVIGTFPGAGEYSALPDDGRPAAPKAPIAPQ